MRKHKGLTKGQSIFFHGLQQFLAFAMWFGCIMLLLYSVTVVETKNANYPSSRISYWWNLFEEEHAFDETATFDDMLMDALQEIIRYNVAKSQLEVDGKFDGTKVIDVRAFVNRKNILQSGQDMPGHGNEEETIAESAAEEWNVQYDAEGKVVEPDAYKPLKILKKASATLKRYGEKLKARIFAERHGK